LERIGAEQFQIGIGCAQISSQEWSTAETLIRLGISVFVLFERREEV
jgi:hypothetical protein